jgi:hypothetical protein
MSVNPKLEIIKNHSLTYNSQKEILEFPEYGRNIQEMILYAKTIGDLAQRQAYIEAIVTLMYQMNPQSKNVDDYKDKLWKHVFQIAEFQLGGVLPPSGQSPTPENTIKKRPEALGYPKINHRFRHYGNHVSLMIQKALTLEEGPIKEGYVSTIGSYMKLAYRTWNKEHFVSDDIIKTDLELLSDGKLSLDDDASFNSLAAANKRRSMDNRSSGRNDTRGGYRSSNDRGTGDRNQDRRRDDRPNDRSNDRGGYRSNTQNDRSNDRTNDRGGYRSNTPNDRPNDRNNDRRRDNNNNNDRNNNMKRR